MQPFFQINKRVTHNTNTGVNEDIDYVRLVTTEVTVVATHKNDAFDHEATNNTDALDVEANDKKEEFEDMDDDSDSEDELILYDYSSDD